MTTIIDIAWAAGIYEGEGHFTGTVVRVVQKDAWLTYELQRKFGGSVKIYRGYHNWSLAGPKARGFILSIFSFLSPRRKEQIKKFPLFFKDSNFQNLDFCPNGHEYTPENTLKNIDGRPGRACKICRKLHYDKKNLARSLGVDFKDVTANPTDIVIRVLAKTKGISIEEAKALYEKTQGVQ